MECEKIKTINGHAEDRRRQEGPAPPNRPASQGLGPRPRQANKGAPPQWSTRLHAPPLGFSSVSPKPALAGRTTARCSL